MNYRSKVITEQQALALVQKNDYIVTGLGAAEAKSFLSQLHTIADRIEDVEINNCLPLENFEFYKKKYATRFNVDSWFYSSPVRQMIDQGNLMFIPSNLHFMGSKRLMHKKPNIYVGSCSAMDKHGYVSLSMSNTYEYQMIEAADTVILEMNPNFPRTLGDVHVHCSKINYLIEADYKVPELAKSESNERDQKIGKFISEYIEDGACIQLGIGGIPNAVTETLSDKKDLGVHTEMLTTGMAELVKAGVITGAKKQIDQGKIVMALALGDRDLYDFMDDNPGLCMMRGSYVNDPNIISQNDNQISINTALEIDLTGQCASESIGARQFSGTGGQVDTVIGAQKSKNGKSFIALYSVALAYNPETGQKEEKSKIVPQLEQGCIVSLSRNDVDYVVTEYGVAHLRGTSINERTKKLIEIAHPKFRAELEQKAYALGFLRNR